MPTAYVKKLVKTGTKKFGKGPFPNGDKIDKKELEHRWKKAKMLAKKEGKEKQWDYIVGIFKKMVGEEYLVSKNLEELND